LFDIEHNLTNLVTFSLLRRIQNSELSMVFTLTLNTI